MDNQKKMFAQKAFFLLSLFVGGIAWLIFTTIIGFVAIQLYKKMPLKRGVFFAINFLRLP